MNMNIKALSAKERRLQELAEQRARLEDIEFGLDNAENRAEAMTDLFMRLEIDRRPRDTDEKRRFAELTKRVEGLLKVEEVYLQDQEKALIRTDSAADDEPEEGGEEDGNQPFTPSF